MAVFFTIHGSFLRQPGSSGPVPGAGMAGKQQGGRHACFV